MTRKYEDILLACGTPLSILRIGITGIGQYLDRLYIIIFEFFFGLLSEGNQFFKVENSHVSIRSLSVSTSKSRSCEQFYKPYLVVHRNPNIVFIWIFLFVHHMESCI